MVMDRAAFAARRFVVLPGISIAVAVTVGITLFVEIGVAEIPSIPLTVVAASSSAREISLETSTLAGATSVVLKQDDVEVARAVTDDVGDDVVRFEGVAIASESCTFTAIFLGAGDAEVASGLPLGVAASDFVPGAPTLALRQQQVVGATPVIRGIVGSQTTTLALFVNGTERASLAATTTGSGFTFHVYGIPYLRNTVAVRAMNVWGSVESTSYAVWNLRTTPKQHTYIVVDKSECRLFYVKNDLYVARYSVGVGTPRTPTPSGEHIITGKRRNVHPRRSGLGAYWMRIAKITKHGLKFSGYFIHGTSWVRSIGRASSLGCVNMLDSQILKFGPTVKVGTHVLIRP